STGRELVAYVAESSFTMGSVIVSSAVYQSEIRRLRLQIPQIICAGAPPQPQLLEPPRVAANARPSRHLARLSPTPPRSTCKAPSPRRRWLQPPPRHHCPH